MKRQCECGDWIAVSLIELFCFLAVSYHFRNLLITSVGNAPW